GPGVVRSGRRGRPCRFRKRPGAGGWRPDGLGQRPDRLSRRQDDRHVLRPSAGAWIAVRFQILEGRFQIGLKISDWSRVLMIRKDLLMGGGAAVMLALAAVGSRELAAQPASAASLAARLVGTWRLVEYVDTDANGNVRRPYGEHPAG